MSDSQIKPIKISPELFNLTPRNVKNKTQKKRQMIKRDMQPNKLKSDLLAKIKNYKYNKHISQDVNATSAESNADVVQIKHQAPINNHSSNTFPKISCDLDNKIDNVDEFTESINFLKELSSKKNKNIQKIIPQLEVSLESNGDVFSKKSLQNSTDFSSINSGEIFDTDNHGVPQYGCLKNSTLPTYREWKNKTLKNSIDEIKTESADNSIYPKHRDKTTTYKYYLGKRGRKIAVLVKNSETRKKISIEHTLLKQTNIHDMKKYLKRHNLLKSGSHAPIDVIKKLYEQSLMGGDIRNSNKDNLIHNYLSES